MNVGASSPEEYGDYFAWAATEPWYTEGHSQDYPCTSWKDGKTRYNAASTPYEILDAASKERFTKYLGSTTSEYKDQYATDENALKTVLDPEDDAAHVNWGGTWRMPTSRELSELCYKCYWVWTTDYNETGVKGYIVYKAKSDSDKGRHIWDSAIPSSDYTLSDNHIFLPAAGWRVDSSIWSGNDGLYLSSTLNIDEPYFSGDLQFKSNYVYTWNSSRYRGLSVRPVCP